MTEILPPELKPQDKNKLESYLPIRNKGNDFDWDIITGLVLSYIVKQEVKGYSFDQLREDCKTQLGELIESDAFWNVLDKMYFSSMDIFKISPLFLLFKAQHSGSSKGLGAANWRMAALFSNLLGESNSALPINDQLNFIETEFLEILNSNLKAATPHPHKEQAYLPFLTVAFKKDLQFLTEHPEYLLQELNNTLRLYAFAYCSQLALNIRDWRNGSPKSKPLYFILDTEKAGTERTQVQRYGYKFFYEASEYLFPMLSALEVLQLKNEPKRPLWQVYHEASQSTCQEQTLEDLNEYIQAFISKRVLEERASALTIEEAFKQIESICIEQFRDESTHRSGINKKYIKEIEAQICSEFIQTRGRSGRVLVLNQDQLLLLTNLAIGKRDKLRLHELIAEFEQRGFYLDKQSHLVLVSFYERMGNVERMSDSGDAFYVRKTV